MREPKVLAWYPFINEIFGTSKSNSEKWHLHRIIPRGHVTRRTVPDIPGRHQAVTDLHSSFYHRESFRTSQTFYLEGAELTEHYFRNNSKSRSALADQYDVIPNLLTKNDSNFHSSFYIGGAEQAEYFT